MLLVNSKDRIFIKVRGDFKPHYNLLPPYTGIDILESPGDIFGSPLRLTPSTQAFNQTPPPLVSQSLTGESLVPQGSRWL